MPLRPIDAIFVDPEQRSYVVYYRGALWKLPRMKMDDRSWQNRRPFKEGSRAIYLSIHQAISDPVLAQKLRTLDLPVAVHGSTLPRFEGWWVDIGYKNSLQRVYMFIYVYNSKYRCYKTTLDVARSVALLFSSADQKVFSMATRC